MWATPRDDRKPFIALMVALVALAWLALWLWGRSPGGLFFGHHGPGVFARGGAFALVFVAGWTVMVVAMMLPTSLPLIMLFRTITRGRRDRALLVALLVAGYLGTWTLFGVLVYLGGSVLHRIAEGSAWLEANTSFSGAGIVALAGLYQFTPLKYKCLEKCRSPLSFVTEHWRGSRERSRSFRLGAHHGLFCVGCCWALMLLMFVVGAGSLGWLLILGAVMAVEKNMPWGRKIGAPLGLALVGAGLVLATAPAFRSPATVEVALAPDDSSGVSGTATFADAPGGVEVGLEVRGLPDPGEIYLAHIHPGSCTGKPVRADEDHAPHHGNADEPAGKIEHPLGPVVTDARGNGSSTTIVEGATVAGLFSGRQSYVNVHAEVSGSEELPDSVACGDLRKSG
jgi:predicted metal-binding membrane protein